MTLQECYEHLHGDYETAKRRMLNERLMDRFILKFPYDDSMSILRNALACGNIKEMFRGAHTLKGVAANLSFTELQNAASDLTEQLRPCTQTADPDLYANVERCYALVIKTISDYAAQKSSEDGL